MKSIIKILSILTCIVLLPCITVGQKTKKDFREALKEYSGKQKTTGDKQDKSGGITPAMLKSATEITYGFNNGSVHPDYHYQGYIIVTPSSVSLKIYNNSRECYSDSEKLTSTQYATFLNRLYGLGVKPNPDDYIPICGGDIYNLKITKGKQILFQGIETENIVTSKGQLCDAFVPLLSGYMKDAYSDPQSTFQEDNIYPNDIFLP